MTKTIIIPILLILTSCARIPQKKLGSVPYRNMDARVIRYVKSFERYYGKNIPNINIKFRDLPGHTGGVCYTLTKKIEIDEPKWKNDKDEYSKEEVIFHELGHCVLNLGHDYHIKRGTRCPISIMYYKGASYKRCYRKYRPYYIMELFFRNKNNKQKVKER